jgi:hypothetical protein
MLKDNVEDLRWGLSAFCNDNWQGLVHGCVHHSSSFYLVGMHQEENAMVVKSTTLCMIVDFV